MVENGNIFVSWHFPDFDYIKEKTAKLEFGNIIKVSFSNDMKIEFTQEFQSNSTEILLFDFINNKKLTPQTNQEDSHTKLFRTTLIDVVDRHKLICNDGIEKMVSGYSESDLINLLLLK